MDEYLQKAYIAYFNALKYLGYVNDDNLQTLIVLTFIYKMVYKDYRGILSKENYSIVEKAVSNICGTNCLLPYRDYLKSGMLYNGSYTELAHKLETLDDYAHQKGDLIDSNEARITVTEDRIDVIEDTKVVKPKETIITVADIQL